MRSLSRIGWSAVCLAALIAGAAGAAYARHETIPYVSGGIGEKAQEALKARESEFNLKLVFTLVEGNYVADVNVVLTDAKGHRLVEHRAEGPFFMARLPAGQYTVAATYNGATVTRKVPVRDKRLRTEYLRWPANPKVDVVLPPGDGMAAAPPAPAAPVAPTLKPAAAPGGLSYVSGGIGEAEQQELKAREGEFNLKLVFTLVEGNYVTDVSVVVSAKGKRIIEHVAQGPFFMARLPAGEYTVSAAYEGRTVTRKVSVAEKRLRTEYLRWPANSKTDLPVSRWITK